MNVDIIKVNSFQDQRPGTSGLRKKVKIFQQKHYLENFIQSLFNCIDANKKKLVIGGDGRFYNNIAFETIVRMAAANGISHIWFAQNGLLSTPAASHLIRKYKADGGIILSASHNPGGKDGDFGIKYNLSNGGSAPEEFTERVFKETKQLSEYRITKNRFNDFKHLGFKKFEGMTIDVIDPIPDYADLMQNIFDFTSIRNLGKFGFNFKFDAMFGATGPYAFEIFEKRLGFKNSILHGVPLPDFGGRPPDPCPKYAIELYQMLMQPNGPDFGAASDGDGDRNFVMGRQTFVSPCDALAVFLDHIDLLPFYKNRVGVARSLPTSRAVDRVAAAKNISCYETPTGWKFFTTLLDTQRIFLCGEESFGTGSDHIREKDGLWSILFWLHILSVRKKTVSEILKAHWKRYGRDYYTRYDYENINIEDAEKFMSNLKELSFSLKNKTFNNLRIYQIKNFFYADPSTGIVSKNQGIFITFETGERIIFRLSGTDTTGATLRIYMEKFESDWGKLFLPISSVFNPLLDVVQEITQLNSYIKKLAPSFAF